MTALGDFLQQQCENSDPWNCSTLSADWCIHLGYPDFAADWRDVVNIEACEAIPAAAGGLAFLWDMGIGDSLPVVTGEPIAGDIAILAAMGFEAGGIFTGERWAMRAPRGLHFIPTDHAAIFKAWRP